MGRSKSRPPSDAPKKGSKEITPADPAEQEAELRRVNARLCDLLTLRRPGLDAVGLVYHLDDAPDAKALAEMFRALVGRIDALGDDPTPEQVATLAPERRAYLEGLEEYLIRSRERAKRRAEAADPKAEMLAECGSVRQAYAILAAQNNARPPGYRDAYNRLRSSWRKRFGGNTLPEAPAVADLADLQNAIDGLERALKTMAAPDGKRPAKRTGRPTKIEKDSATKVVAALNKHHGYGENGSVANREAATNRDLATKYDLSGNALSRFLADAFSDDGHKKYTTACRDGKIDAYLALWNRELPGRLAKLPPESGRESND